MHLAKLMQRCYEILFQSTAFLKKDMGSTVLLYTIGVLVQVHPAAAIFRQGL